MTQCQNIICSIISTFAFWAAYLNDNEKKQVFAHYDGLETDWYPQSWDVEISPCQSLDSYPDVREFINSSLDNS